MIERVQLKRKIPPRNDDDEMEFDKVDFIPSGSTLLDFVLGGGWALGRTINLVGDSSTGKTLLAIEACAKFARVKGNWNIRYCESEAAFDVPYARTMGFPHEIKPLHLNTIEDVAKDLERFVTGIRKGDGGLYVMDSFDALTDKAELERAFDQAGYGMEKVKLLGKLFRMQTRAMEEAACTLIIISQTRDAIGVTFGEKKTRSGGKALRFYSSQEIWLAQTGTIRQTIRGTERVIGINVRARMKKNKVGRNNRECDLELIFDYGLDDEMSMINFLVKNKEPEFTPSGWIKDLKAARRNQDRDAIREIASELRIKTATLWAEIEQAFTPPLSKYEDEEE